MTNVATLKPVKASAPKQQLQPSSKTTAFRKRLKRQAVSAVGIGLVAGTLTALSLTHLADGITIVTSAPAWQAWAMAAGIDLGFIALEMAQITAASEAIRKQITGFTKPAIIGTLTGSAAMNAFAFGTGATGWLVYPAIAFGIAIPALLYCLTRVGAALYLDCAGRG